MMKSSAFVKKYAYKIDYEIIKKQIEISKTLKKEKNVNDLINDFDNAFNLFDKNGELKEEEINAIFNEVYNIGKWQGEEDVYFPRKLIGYLFNGHHPHIANGELSYEDIKELNNILNYEDYANEKEGVINFITKSQNRDGYYDCVMETIDNDYKIFHYQYKNEKNAMKRIKKIKTRINRVIL